MEKLTNTPLKLGTTYHYNINVLQNNRNLSTELQRPENMMYTLDYYLQKKYAQYFNTFKYATKKKTRTLSINYSRGVQFTKRCFATVGMIDNN